MENNPVQNQTEQPVVTPTPSQPPTEPKKDGVLKSKWLILGIVAVVLIAGIGGAYTLSTNQTNKSIPVPPPNEPIYQSPTPTLDPTDNWKTYNDSSGVFSFKYPSSWVVKTRELKNDPLVYVYDPASATQMIQNGGSTVTVYTSYFQVDAVEYPDGGRTPEGAAQDYENNWKQISPTTNLHRTSGKINGYDVEIIDTAGEGSSGRNVYIGYGMNTVDINSSIKSLTDNDIENQILSTFKFTDSSNSITANPGEHCGGNIANAKQCSSGYHCQLEKVADLGGTCVKN